jgi:hypothetical protein
MEQLRLKEKARAGATQAKRANAVAPRSALRTTAMSRTTTRGTVVDETATAAWDFDDENARHDAAASGFKRVKISFVKNIFGIFMLPIAWVLTVSFVSTFRHAAVHLQYWRTEDFWFFVLGAVLWGLAFSGSLYARGEPVLLHFYVWIHEHTHAIWTWLSNGKVSELKVYRDHGHILTNKPTVLVTLAPYFYPLPCVVLITAFLLIRPFYVLENAPALLWGFIYPMQIFLILMGGAWSFHCTFTVWMIRRGQSDLRMHGNLFSLVLIYIVNLAVLSLFLILTAPGVELETFSNELLFNAQDFSDAVWTLGCKVLRQMLS